MKFNTEYSTGTQNVPGSPLVTVDSVVRYDKLA